LRNDLPKKGRAMTNYQEARREREHAEKEYLEARRVMWRYDDPYEYSRVFWKTYLGAWQAEQEAFQLEREQ
jgi:hypothetical protein